MHDGAKVGVAESMRGTYQLDLGMASLGLAVGPEAS